MTEVPRRTLAESHNRTQSATTAGSPRLRYKRDIHLTRSETAPLFIDLLPAAHRSPASAPAPAHTARARPGRRRRRTGWRASCGSLGSKRWDVGPRSYCWLVETVTKRNGSPEVPCRTRRASQRTAARCGGSSASTTVSAAASIRSSACVRRTGVLRTYREVVVMWA